MEGAHEKTSLNTHSTGTDDHHRRRSRSHGLPRRMAARRHPNKDHRRRRHRRLPMVRHHQLRRPRRHHQALQRERRHTHLRPRNPRRQLRRRRTGRHDRPLPRTRRLRSPRQVQRHLGVHLPAQHRPHRRGSGPRHHLGPSHRRPELRRSAPPGRADLHRRRRRRTTHLLLGPRRRRHGHWLPTHPYLF